MDKNATSAYRITATNNAWEVNYTSLIFSHEQGKTINNSRSKAPKPSAHCTKEKIISNGENGKRCCALCPEAAVIVLLGSCRVHLFILLRWLRRQHMYRVLVRRVDVRLRRRHRHLDRVLSFVHLDDAQVRTDLGIALRTPRNI